MSGWLRRVIVTLSELGGRIFVHVRERWHPLRWDAWSVTDVSDQICNSSFASCGAGAWKASSLLQGRFEEPRATIIMRQWSEWRFLQEFVGTFRRGG